MNRSVVVHPLVPLAGLGGLLAVACLGSTWHINRLQDHLRRTLRADSAALQAALEAQIQLRRLRFHSFVHAADPSTPGRVERIAQDRTRFEAALADLRRNATRPEDATDLDALEGVYAQYVADLHTGDTPAFRSVADLIRWSDEHHVSRLMEPYQVLTDRTRERMTAALSASEDQSRWAGRALLAVGLVGPVAGIAAGYAVARGWSRRVAELSVRVQAVHAHLDHEVGAMTLDAAGSVGDLDRQLDRVVGRVKEVCERLQASEREKLQAEQLAAVGHLATGVAHEVRNPLTGIKLLVQAAVRPRDPAPLTPDRLGLVLGEIARIERTVQGLMNFARTPPPAPERIDLRGLVGESVRIAAGRAEGKGITVRADAGGPLAVVADRDGLISLLTNLLFNAIDAAPPAGEVGVRAAAADGRVRVEVSDSGPGIDPAVAGRLFTPFATTKPTGTGLGLTVARRAARDHGGTLDAAPRPGGGTVFTFTMPAAEDDKVTR